MGDAKRIIVKPIAAADAARIVKALHYSGKVVQNSQVHLGVFLDGKCGGAMQFGPSLDKRKIQGLVRDTKWNEFIELNRMAFADWLPRNGESRAIGFAMRWLKKTYPWLQWVISFADAAQCGDGTIYRASGFVLTGFGKCSIFAGQDGSKYQQATISARGSIANKLALKYQHENGGGLVEAFCKAKGLSRIEGQSLRYIYFLDPTARERLTVPVLPFSEIERRGAGMYRGKPISRAGSIDADAPVIQTGEGGSTPTPALHSKP